MARKLVENDFLAPPQKNLGGVKKMFVKNEKNQSCSKLPEMASKLVENDFRTFQPPPRKILGRKQNFVKNEKNQSCSKLPEMARKLVENDFCKRKYEKVLDDKN